VEEESVKQLFRRFALDECGPKEALEVIEILQNQEAINWFGEMMDQMQETGIDEEDHVTEQFVHQCYYALESELAPPVYHGKFQRLWWSSMRGIAASVAVFLVLTAVTIYFFTQNRTVTQKTGFGEIKNLTLPDGSTVVLHGNSMITYPNNWKKARKVSLQGEAYFSVTKTADSKPFTVEMTNAGEIEVLGTEFNVNHRKENSKVVLRSGVIRLKLRARADKKDLLMHPGELVEFSSGRLTTKKVNPAVYDTWTSRKLVFDNTSLKEIAIMLKENYNLNVQVNDAALLNKKISGTAPITDLSQFLNALSGSFNLKITRDQHRVIIEEAP
jgi:transmembrane sensor